MVVSFAAWGSFVTNFTIERLAAICILYFLALGISAHCLDALGSQSKPWGILSKKKFLAVSLSSLSVACLIGLYYAIFYSQLLFPIGIAETFFLFAYNLELFKGRFHNSTVLVISWGILPVFAGCAIQTNTISNPALILAGVAAGLSFLLLKTSRRYKKLIQEPTEIRNIHKEEIVLKLVSFGVIGATISYLFLRYA